jgi:hypothetical protein
MRIYDLVLHAGSAEVRTPEPDSSTRRRGATSSRMNIGKGGF